MNIDYKKLYLKEQKDLEDKRKRIEALKAKIEAKKNPVQPTYKAQLLEGLKKKVLQGIPNANDVIKNIETVSDKHKFV